MSKYRLAVCEIHNPFIHGTDYTSDPNISNHFLIETQSIRKILTTSYWVVLTQKANKVTIWEDY